MRQIKRVIPLFGIFLVFLGSGVFVVFWRKVYMVYADMRFWCWKVGIK